ncbi:MAG: FAD-binding oxidoreductase [Sneathiella sp.]|nr:FAD-binding oxidoreductase [Sneathiella sp.]
MAHETYDIVVVGAGIAGASIAAELCAHARVLLLERESQPGYHTTGRSAAVFAGTYGPPIIRALSRASKSFFDNPRSEFISHPLLKPRGLLFTARQDQLSHLDELQEELGDTVTRIDANKARDIQPLLQTQYINAALYDEKSADIDVDALHQHYLKTFRALGGEIQTTCEVTGLSNGSTGWTIETPEDEYQTAIIVNAAGAWADELAKLANLPAAGLTPKRRTALLVSPPNEMDIEQLPMTVDVEEQFYLKPDAGKLLLSPADETPSAPCDAQPEELDVAICVDRIEKAFDLQVRRIDHKWAGLRSFFPDKCPIAGFDPSAEGFFWLAGQGGYGIQSAPALAKVAASLVLGRSIPSDIENEGVDANALSRNREGFAA